jgi:hypothetical protein
LIVMDRPDFCFFFFFFFTPLHHPIQHPQVGRWAVETITCGGPLGIYSAIHSRREEVNTYIHTLPPSSRQQQQQQPQQICRAAGNWPGASAATRDADRKSVRPFISFSR